MTWSGRKVWGWVGAAAAVVILSSGCVKEPTSQHAKSYETFNAGDSRTRGEGLKARFDTSAGYSDPGYMPPVTPGSGPTLTSSFVPPVEGATAPERVDETTAPASELKGVTGSAATGMYVQEEEAFGGSGEFAPLGSEQGQVFTGTQPGGLNTVNPGRGSLPQLQGTGNSLLPTEPSVPRELRWGAGMWGQQGE